MLWIPRPWQITLQLSHVFHLKDTLSYNSLFMNQALVLELNPSTCRVLLLSSSSSGRAASRRFETLCPEPKGSLEKRWIMVTSRRSHLNLKRKRERDWRDLLKWKREKNHWVQAFLWDSKCRHKITSHQQHQMTALWVWTGNCGYKFPCPFLYFWGRVSDGCKEK